MPRVSGFSRRRSTPTGGNLFKSTLLSGGGERVARPLADNDAARELGRRIGVPAYFPSRHLSTDNAAMIAAAGSVKLQAGMSDGLDLDADVSLRLQNIGLEEDAHTRGRIHYRH